MSRQNFSKGEIMRRRLFGLDDHIVLALTFLTALIFMISLSNCGRGYLLTKSGGSEKSAVEEEENVPNEIVPSEPPPNEEQGNPDNFFERVFYLCATSHGASSAEIWLNDELVFGTDCFHNDDWSECRGVSLVSGENELRSGYTVRGKPHSDRIEIEVRELNPDTGKLYDGYLFRAEIVRKTGKPEEFFCSFFVY